MQPSRQGCRHGRDEVDADGEDRLSHRRVEVEFGAPCVVDHALLAIGLRNLKALKWAPPATAKHANQVTPGIKL